MQPPSWLLRDYSPAVFALVSIYLKHLPYFQEVVNSLHNSATLALCFHHFVDSFTKKHRAWGIAQSPF
jgi:hypothetical protein